LFFLFLSYTYHAIQRGLKSPGWKATQHNSIAGSTKLRRWCTVSTSRRRLTTPTKFKKLHKNKKKTRVLVSFNLLITFLQLCLRAFSSISPCSSISIPCRAGLPAMNACTRCVAAAGRQASRTATEASSADTG
jgi:hypothetical protein